MNSIAVIVMSGFYTVEIGVKILVVGNFGLSSVGGGGEGVELPCYHRNWSSEWMRWLYLKIVWTIIHGRGKIPSFVNCLKIYVMYIRFFWGVYAIIYSLNLGIFSFSAPRKRNIHNIFYIPFRLFNFFWRINEKYIFFFYMYLLNRRQVSES